MELMRTSRRDGHPPGADRDRRQHRDAIGSTEVQKLFARPGSAHPLASPDRANVDKLFPSLKVDVTQLTARGIRHHRAVHRRGLRPGPVQGLEGPPEPGLGTSSSPPTASVPRGGSTSRPARHLGDDYAERWSERTRRMAVEPQPARAVDAKTEADAEGGESGRGLNSFGVPRWRVAAVPPPARAGAGARGGGLNLVGLPQHRQRRRRGRGVRTTSTRLPRRSPGRSTKGSGTADEPAPAARRSRTRTPNRKWLPAALDAIRAAGPDGLKLQGRR
ncbi:hypothetical protein ACU686_02825 [Yinghuangia aomiensis]